MLSVAFTGDVSFSDDRGRPGPSGRSFSPELVDALRECDYRIFNIEGPITNAPPEKKIGAIVRSRPEFLPLLEKLHCNVFTLANNHTFDHGFQGYTDTVTAARSRGWLCVGAGEDLESASTPLILKSKETSLGIISVCHEEGPVAGANTYGVLCHTHADLIRHRIGELKRQCDWVGVIYHGGEEIYRFPLPCRRKRLLGYLSLGADFVIAHHAHVVQGFEAIDGKYVFYGLGDFAFDAWPAVPPDPGVNESVLLVLKLESGHPVRFVPLFTYHDRNEGRVRIQEANPWFCEIPHSTYRASYTRYASDVFRGWMTIADNPRPSVLRQFRRVVGLTRTLKDRAKRPLFLAGARQLAVERLRRAGRDCAFGS